MDSPKLKALLAARDTPLKYNKEEFLKGMRALLETPGYTTETDKSAVTKQEEPMTVKEEPKLSEEEQALAALAEEVTAKLEATTETFMLNSPMALTVKKPGGAYSKVAHIGSEDFAPLRAYIGKRNSMIFVFKPVMVTDYSEMEMTEAQAYSSLTGFKEFAMTTLGNLKSRRTELTLAAAHKREQERHKERFDTYKDIGYGSW